MYINVIIMYNYICIYVYLNLYIYILSLLLLQDNCLQRPSRTYPQTPLGRWRRSNKPMVNRVEKTSERSIQDNLGQDTSSQ